MKNLLKKIPFINRFIKEDDWHNPEYILNVIKETDLKKIKRRTLKELKKEEVINPKALFYLHKYVDASFNKKALNVEGKFLDKQNNIDQLYALGKSEVYSLIADYYDILRETKEAEERLKKTILALEPNSMRISNNNVIYEDDNSFYQRFENLAQKLEWNDYNEKER